MGVIHPMRWLIVPIFVVAADAQKFEVAAIKRCQPDATASGVGPPTPGHITVNCISVMNLIRQAHVLFANGTLNLPGRTVPIEKGPPWIESDLYTIEAKAEGAADQGTMLGPMMRELLEDRFRLKLHSETREVTVYALTAVKGGPKLTPAPPGGCAALDIDHPPPPPLRGQPLLQVCGFARITRNGFDIRGVNMGELAHALAGRLDREVVDRTEIAGTFDFEVVMFPGASGATLGPPAPSPGAAPPPPAPPPPPEAGVASEPGAVVAATRAALQKFGLRLETARGPERFFVIDSVERPSEN